MSWNNPARVEKLKRLWDEGHSASVIARQLGVTRNAVIGKVRRLHLAHRAPSGAHSAQGVSVTRDYRHASSALASRLDVRTFGADRPRIDCRKLPRPHWPPLALADKTDTPKVSTFDLEAKHCRWPCGDPLEISPRDPLFCGDPRIPGTSYCERHLRRSRGLPDPKRPAPSAPVPAEAEPVLQAA
jgi:GcrA cell cycle regulator